jgi:hypothetical protein
MDEAKPLTCPCCGYRTIFGEFDICGVCWWEHDKTQWKYPYCAVGANGRSLVEAQREFLSEQSLPPQQEGARRNATFDPSWRRVEDYPWLDAGSDIAGRAYLNLRHDEREAWGFDAVARQGADPKDVRLRLADTARQFGFEPRPGESSEALPYMWQGQFELDGGAYSDENGLEWTIQRISRPHLESYGVERFARFFLAACAATEVELGRSDSAFCVGDPHTNELDGPLEFVDWIQYWSAPIVARWGLEKLRSGPFHRIDAFPDGAAAVWLAPDPFSETMSRAAAAEFLGITLRPLVGDHPDTGERVHIPWP